MTGRILIKPGAQFTVIRPAGYCILAALKHTAQQMGRDLTITSACEGEHSGPMDPHKLGEAYDVRSHDFEPAERPQVLASVMLELGWTRFYGFLEAEGTSNEHWHFQRAKNTTFSIGDLLAA